MQGTSANYNPYVDEIRTDALIEFELIDVDAAQTATATASIQPASFSSVYQTHNRITQNSMKLATLDRDLWKLDGSFSLPNHVDNLETGYFSSVLSDSSGNINLVIQYTFPHLQDSDGFTLIFDTKAEEVADTFTLDTYNGATKTGSTTVTGNRDVFCFIPTQSEGYDKVVLTFTKTAKPYRRIRLTELVFGHLQQFKGNRIQQMRVIYECGLYMENMPASMLEFTIDNSDRAYNVLNPTGIYRFLQDGQGLNASVSVNGESVNLGRFYFETAKANDDNLTATVTAYDLLYRLDNSTYNKGRTGTWTVAEACADIIADAGVEIPLNIDAELGARVIRRCIPQDTSHREALRMVAQAGMMVLYFNRIGELKAKTFEWGAPVDVLTPRNMRGSGEAMDRGLINHVIVTQNDAYAQTEVQYVADNRRSGQPLQVLETAVPLAMGQDVAEWILMCAQNRNTYNVPAQSNPARDIGDCISIANVYGYSDNAVVIKQETTYDGSLIDTLSAFGGGGNA